MGNNTAAPNAEFNHASGPILPTLRLKIILVMIEGRKRQSTQTCKLFPDKSSTRSL